ncbi:MAG TPA: Mov34/MPN/PAD-1 family protein [Phycisphaerae bacterium]|nr:Mov34/MPN/PAD-1 family protein [Phycisphaerae bacterium]HNU46994.1 Mov34/MPN/PAD-1 family protein [Phycisphaerae bacterium]
MPHTYRFPKKALARIARASRKADIHEVCYLVFGRGGRVRSVVRMRNHARDTVLHHAFGAAEWARVRRKQHARGLNCLGALHTHPIAPAVPGRGDLAGYPPGSLMFIYADCDRELRAYRLKRGGRGYVEKRIVLV